MSEAYERYTTSLRDQLNTLSQVEVYLEELENVDLSNIIRTVFSIYNKISSSLNNLEKEENASNIIKIVDRIAKQLAKFNEIETEVNKIDIEGKEYLSSPLTSLKQLVKDTLALSPIIEDVKKGGVSKLLDKFEVIIDSDYKELVSLFDKVRIVFDVYSAISSHIDDLEKRMAKLKKNEKTITSDMIKIIDKIAKQLDKLDELEINNVANMKKLLDETPELKSHIENAKKERDINSTSTLIREFRLVIDADYNNVIEIINLYDKISDIFDNYEAILPLLNELEEGEDIPKIIDSIAEQVNKFDTVEQELNDIKVNKSLNGIIASVRKLANDTLALKPYIKYENKEGIATLLRESRAVINRDYQDIKDLSSLFDRIREIFGNYETISSLLDDLERRDDKLKEGEKVTPNMLKIIERIALHVDKFNTLEGEIDKIDVGDNGPLAATIANMRKLVEDTLNLKSYTENLKKKGDVSTLLNEFRLVIDGDYNDVKDFLAEIGQIIKEGGVDKEEEAYLEFVYNIVDTINKLLFSEAGEESGEAGGEKEENYMAKAMEKVRTYAREVDIYSPINPLQEKGYLLNKKEEESFKMGTKGTKGITTCGVCKMDNIIIYSAQKRGMDEGETIFNTCVDCGHKWVIR